MEEIKDNETVDLKGVFIDYLTHWKLIGGCGIFAFVVAVLYIALYPKTYEAAAQILLQDDKETFSSPSMGLGSAAGLMASFGLSGASGSSIVLDDELMTLTSNQMVREMVIKLGIYVDYMEPFSFGYRMYGQEPLRVSCDSATLVKLERTVKMEIEHQATGKVKIDTDVKFSTFDHHKKSFTLESLPGVIEVEGWPIRIDYAPGKESVKNTSFDLLVDVNPPTGVAEELIEEFLIEDYSKSSNVLQMSCEDYETQRAKDMFQTLIDCYNESAERYKWKLANSTLDFLNGRLETTLAELANIEKLIEQYKTKNKITMVEYDVQLYATSMQEVQTKLIELEAQRHLIDLMEEFVRNPENKYKLVPSLFTPADGESGVGGAITNYNQVLMERERLIKVASENNPMVAPLTLPIDRLRERVYVMIENTRKSMDATEASLKSKEKQLLSKMGEVPQQERTYVDLKRQQEIYQGVYLVLLQKREDIILTVNQGKERAKIIDAPYIKSALVAPRKLYAAIGIILFTMLASMGWLAGKWFVLSIWKDLKVALKKK